MVRTPKSLDEAKQIAREEAGKIATSLSTIAGSRWLMAILATLALTFGSHVIYAPDRLPVLNWLNWGAVGLPPSVDFGFAGAQWQEMQAAAQRNDVAGHVQETLAANADQYATINLVAFSIALALLLANMWLMTRRRAYTRG